MKKQKTIFELELIEYESFGKKPKYPSFKVECRRLGVYSSLAKAEQGIKKYIKQEKRDEKLEKDNRTQSIFGFKINEVVLNEVSYWCAVSRRNYLQNGFLWDECLLSEVCKKDGLEEFLGRPKEKMRFEIGDLAEVLFGDEVRLEIVGNQPLTPEEVQQMHERCRKKYPDFYFPLDHSDDSYYTLDKDGGHSHPEAVTMFPVQLKVSKKLKKKLNSIYANPESWS